MQNKILSSYSSPYTKKKNSNRHAEKNKQNNLKWFILLLLVMVGSLSIVYFVKKNEIHFALSSQKYQPILHELKQIHNKDTQVKEIQTWIQDTLLPLTITHPTDGNLFYFLGFAYFELFLKSIDNFGNTLIEIYFLDYLNKYTPPSNFNNDFWQKSILYFRKALHLNLNTSYHSDLILKLYSLYSYGGASYMNNQELKILEALFPLLKDSDYILFSQWIYLFYPQYNTKINWEQLKRFLKKYSISHYEDLDNQVNFLKACFYLKQKKTQLSYYLFNALINKKQPVPSNIQNKVYYLMSILNDKNYKKKLYFLKKIYLQEFLKKYKWFYTEYAYFLRFTGNKKDLKSLIKIVEGFNLN